MQDKRSPNKQPDPEDLRGANKEEDQIANTLVAVQGSDLPSHLPRDRAGRMCTAVLTLGTFDAAICESSTMN